MERSMLSRGKRLDNGEWVYGYYVKHDTIKVCFSTDDPATKHYIVQDGFCDWGFEPKLELFEVDPATVGQSIEMCDRSKRTVFENDIIEFSGGLTHRYLIWWHREGSMMTAVPIDDEFRFNGHDYYNNYTYEFNYSTFCMMMQDPWGDFKDIRVVGNIHDNPELLEGAN